MCWSLCLNLSPQTATWEPLLSFVSAQITPPWRGVSGHPVWSSNHAPPSSVLLYFSIAHININSSVCVDCIHPPLLPPSPPSAQNIGASVQGCFVFVATLLVPTKEPGSVLWGSERLYNFLKSHSLWVVWLPLVEASTQNQFSLTPKYLLPFPPYSKLGQPCIRFPQLVPQQ